jgi:hypothetical protein
MNSLVNLCILLVAICASTIHATTTAPTGIAALQVQQAMSSQYSNLILELQSLVAFSRTLSGWYKLSKLSGAGQQQQQQYNNYFEESNNVDNEDDFSMNAEKKVNPVGSEKSLEMFFGQMDAMSGVGMYGQTGMEIDPAYDEARKIESQSEYSFLLVLKYLYLVNAKRLETSQTVHYQSKLALGALQAAGATNPMASQMLYMLYMRDIMQIMMTANSLQRHDALTLWNFLEIIETNEFPARDAPDELKQSIKKANFGAFKAYYTEASLDFQIFFIDYYLQAMMAQAIAPAAAAAATTATTPLASSFVQEEMTEGATPEKPFFPTMMSNPQQYMVYYMFMMKFFSKSLLVQGVQALFMEASSALAPNHNNQGARVDPAQIRHRGILLLSQWCQIRYFQVTMDVYMMFSGMAAQTTPQTHASAAAMNNFVQVENPQAQPQSPVIEVPVQAPVPQSVPQPQNTQSVVG